jgi:hypothetical protein
MEQNLYEIATLSTITVGVLLIYYFSGIGSPPKSKDIKKVSLKKKSSNTAPVVNLTASKNITVTKSEDVKTVSSSTTSSDSRSSEMKGYKMTSDGRKTRYVMLENINWVRYLNHLSACKNSLSVCTIYDTSRSYFIFISFPLMTTYLRYFQLF